MKLQAKRRRRGARSESCHPLPQLPAVSPMFHRQDMLGATWTATARSPTTTTRSTPGGWRNMASNLNGSKHGRRRKKISKCNPINGGAHEKINSENGDCTINISTLGDLTNRIWWTRMNPIKCHGISRWHVTPSPPGTHWATDFNKNCRKSLKSIVFRQMRRDHLSFNFEIGNLRGTSLIPSNNSQLVSKFGASPKLDTVPQDAKWFL